MTRNPSGLETALAELSQLYPELRFGQLIEMIALLACEDALETPNDLDDTRLHQAAVAHLSNRMQQLDVERTAVLSVMSHERIELLELFHELHGRHPHWRFGQLASTVAGWCAVSLYDAEDEQLLAAGRRHLVGDNN